MSLVSFLSRNDSPVAAPPAPTPAQLAAEVQLEYIEAGREKKEADAALWRYQRTHFDTRTSPAAHGIKFEVNAFSNPKHAERRCLEAAQARAQLRFNAALEARVPFVNQGLLRQGEL
jgi:hypothetical protein